MLKWITYDLRLSSSHFVMLSMAAEDLLCHYPSMKCITKCPLNSLKVETVFGVSLLNHTLTNPFIVVRNALHMISSRTPCRCMRVLHDSKWLSRPLDPSYAFTCGIRNFAGRGKQVTWAVMDTHHLIAFIIISIFSFIIYISWAMRIALTSISKGRLVSSRQSFLLGTLFSS